MSHEQGWATAHYGPPCNGDAHALVTAFGRRLTVHRRYKRAIRRIDRVFREHAPDYYRHVKGRPDTGIYACRTIAGTNLKSLHSWALPIDIAWSENGRGLQTSPIEKRAMKAIRILEEDGFVWGGRWSNPDNMHIQPGPRLTPKVVRERFTFDGKRKRWWKKELERRRS